MRYGLTRWDTLDFESSHIEDQQGRGWSLNQVLLCRLMCLRMLKDFETMLFERSGGCYRSRA